LQLNGRAIPLPVWTATLVACSLAFVAALVSSGFTAGNLPAVAGLALAAAVAERGRVRLTKNLEESISLLPTLFAAVVFGPLASMIVAAASLATDLRSPYLRWTTYTASRSLTGGVTGIVAFALADASSRSFASIAAATAAGAAVSQVLDTAFVWVTLKLRGNDAVFDQLRTEASLALVAVPLYTPVVAALAVAYEDISIWAVLLFFMPAVAAQRLFGLYQEQRRLAETLVSTNDRLERASLSFATALVATLDARDRYTAGHSAAVAIYARDIARRMNLSPQEQELVHLCGLVHDIGKIGLPPGLLEKPGALTLDERRQMQEHSAIGERILAKVEDYAEIATIVRHHHERIDGMGYPDGRAGDDIPLLSRIIAVADAYNAMTSARPYRDAMPSRVARMRLAQAVEGQFDTSVVAAFEAILAGADESYRSGTGSEFVFELKDDYDQTALSRVA
jgi:putative nucleotidyltransferase with HDIG domain